MRRGPVVTAMARERLKQPDWSESGDGTVTPDPFERDDLGRLGAGSGFHTRTVDCHTFTQT